MLDHPLRQAAIRAVSLSHALFVALDSYTGVSRVVPNTITPLSAGSIKSYATGDTGYLYPYPSSRYHLHSRYVGSIGSGGCVAVAVMPSSMQRRDLSHTSPCGLHILLYMRCINARADTRRVATRATGIHPSDGT